MLCTSLCIPLSLRPSSLRAALYARSVLTFFFLRASSLFSLCALCCALQVCIHRFACSLRVCTRAALCALALRSTLCAQRFAALHISRVRSSRPNVALCNLCSALCILRSALRALRTALALYFGSFSFFEILFSSLRFRCFFWLRVCALRCALSFALSYVSLFTRLCRCCCLPCLRARDARPQQVNERFNQSQIPAGCKTQCGRCHC